MALFPDSLLKTLQTFLAEAGLPESAAETTKGDLTIENVLHEKQVFDTTLALEKLGDDQASNQWGDKGR